MSELVERLAAKWRKGAFGEVGPFVAARDARWWLNEIAEELDSASLPTHLFGKLLTAEGDSFVGYQVAVQYLREQAATHESEFSGVAGYFCGDCWREYEETP